MSRTNERDGAATTRRIDATATTPEPQTAPGPHEPGRVAVVTGASRGVGKGVAVALAHAGWTVYATGRSAARLAETVEAAQTSQNGTAAAGRVVAVECDHRDDSQIEELFARVTRERGRLDLLVNNVWTNPKGFLGFGARFWERPVSDWDSLVGVGLRAHYVASVEAAKLMVPRGSGQIVHISSFGSRAPFHTVLYGMTKTALDKMAADMAHDLRDTGVRCNSLWLGLVRTELILSFGIADFNGFPLDRAEDPGFVGRVVDALARDAAVRSGDTLVSAEYGRARGILNDDGQAPLSHRGAFGGGPLFPPVTDAQLGLDVEDEVAAATGRAGAAEQLGGN